MKNIKLILAVFATMFYSISFANNLSISNASRPAPDEVSFDISWENSWYINFGANNWDAVWVFIKGQDCTTPTKLWGHIDVSLTGHTAGSGLQIDVPSDGKGVFIRRSSQGVGAIPTTSITLKLDGSFPEADVNMEIMGIEMVSVLEGAYQIGGASAASHSFKITDVTSEAAISASEFYNGTEDNSKNAPLAGNFPKGYNRFYVMKYEITQEQYVRFLNLLQYDQQESRTSFSPEQPPNSNALSSPITGTNHRNGVSIMQAGSDNLISALYGCNLFTTGVSINLFDEDNDGQNIACNYLSWTDLLAYLDWAALRPMTELEYEKACRGPKDAVADEFAWGNAKATPGNEANTNSGESNEMSTTVAAVDHGLAVFNGSQGPLRVGIFGRTSTPTRIQTGSTYWGIMDMTGNTWEQCISAGYNDANSSAFDGELGDGEIGTNGEANATSWDLDAAKSIVKGGGFNTSTTELPTHGSVSGRGNVGVTTFNSGRYMSTGGRGVRQF